jgi:hypothetical protein
MATRKRITVVFFTLVASLGFGVFGMGRAHADGCTGDPNGLYCCTSSGSGCGSVSCTVCNDGSQGCSPLYCTMNRKQVKPEVVLAGLLAKDSAIANAVKSLR